MNSIPGREPRADTRDINQPKETHKRGCYLALTFGTLLSSQGADAQQLDPLGLSSLAECPTLRRDRLFPLGDHPAGLSAPRGASRTIHESAGPCTGGPAAPA